MNPWDILGWLLVFIVALVVLSLIAIIVIFIISGIVVLIEKAQEKKKTKFEKNYEIFKSTKEEAFDGFQP